MKHNAQFPFLKYFYLAVIQISLKLNIIWPFPIIYISLQENGLRPKTLLPQCFDLPPLNPWILKKQIASKPNFWERPWLVIKITKLLKIISFIMFSLETRPLNCILYYFWPRCEQVVNKGGKYRKIEAKAIKVSTKRRGRHSPRRPSDFSISNSDASHLALGHVMGEAAAHAP